ncbi:MAG: DUF4266 domain-containing protein [Myxococcota bacterium]
MMVWLLAWLGGCATLATYERGALLTPQMRDPCDPGAAASLTRVVELREAMAGATTTGSAPCGCN